MNFISKQLNSNTLGSLFKQSRETQGLSLKDIEQETGISTKYLQFLETDDFYKFPSTTYTRGILKRYAETLELDARSIVNKWEQEYNTALSSPVYRKRFSLSSMFAHRTGKSKKKLVYFKNIVALAIFILILLYIGVTIRTAISPPLIEMIHPPDEFITNNTMLIAAGVTEPYSEVFINNQLIGTADKEGKFKQAIALLPGLNTIEISAKKKYSRKKTVYRQVVLEE